MPRRTNRKKGKSNMPKNKKALVSLIKKVDTSNDELKMYAYQPVASGVVNTSGLRYLLNAMPFANATVTAGVLDVDTPGMRGPGGMQVLGKDYFVKSIGFKAQVRQTSDVPRVVRCIIFREHSPEGVAFSTGPFSLLHTQVAGLGVVAPIWKVNLLKKDQSGRFKVYYDKTWTITNSLVAQNHHKIINFNKTFRNPVRVCGYEANTTQVVATTAVVGNIQNNAFYAMIFSDDTTLTVDQAYCYFTFTDA